MAVKNLKSNKVRSFLTMLGVIIGVGAVIAMVSLGEGAKQQITERINEMGSNLLIVTPTRNGLNSINNNTVEVVKSASPFIQTVAPAVRGEKVVEAGGESIQASIIGCTPAYGEVRNYHVKIGRFFNGEENNSRHRVAVIGSYIAQELFPGTNPVGESIKIGNVRAEIVGILTEKGQSGFGNVDNVVLLPLSTAQQRIFGNANLSEINIQVKAGEYINAAYEEVHRVLIDKFKDEDKFNINNMAEVLSTAQDMTRTMTMLLAGIAAVSLMVGGIGIMNIMLVSVTERIREIGIRKAIGAQPEEILVLFLIEAVTLSLIGGGIGIFSGAALAILFGKLIGWTITVSMTAVAVAFIFSLLVGLFFGVYPAYKAGRLNPIEALRHE